MSSLELSNIRKTFGDFDALKGINLNIEPGEFVVMVGPSGCGKSTLLKAIAGLESLTSGQIYIKGKDVTNAEPSERGIAMVFQSYALYPHMSVAENMGFGLKLAGKPKPEIETAVLRAADILKLTDQMDKLPRQLSGGQRQRVAIGRAITRQPEVFLFDEPLSNLDAALRTQMRVELSSLHAQMDSTMVYVTHDQVEAMTMADRIVVLNDGQIEQAGSPLELYSNPTNHFVAGFLGAPRMNFFEAEIVKITGTEVALEAANILSLNVQVQQGAPLAPGDKVLLGVRPEHIELCTGGGDGLQFEAEARLVEHLGRETIVYADAGGLQCVGSDTGTSNITIQLDRIVRQPIGTKMHLKFDADAAYLFDKAGQTVSTPKSL